MEKGIIKELIGKIPQVGKVVWIGIREKRLAPLKSLDEVFADKETSLEGDHFAGKFSKKRQVTLIQDEHLIAVGSMLGSEKISPELTRRNIVIRGINLLALKDQQFQIGNVILQGTGYCYPCSRMEDNLGAGGYNAMRGHGGITAEIITSGSIKVNDDVALIK